MCNTKAGNRTSYQFAIQISFAVPISSSSGLVLFHASRSVVASTLVESWANRGSSTKLHQVEEMVATKDPRRRILEQETDPPGTRFEFLQLKMLEQLTRED
ncbi:unnamed protein product [Amaranthus hypochondriacus]